MFLNSKKLGKKSDPALAGLSDVRHKLVGDKQYGPASMPNKS